MNTLPPSPESLRKWHEANEPALAEMQSMTTPESTLRKAQEAVAAMDAANARPLPEDDQSYYYAERGHRVALESAAAEACIAAVRALAAQAGDGYSPSVAGDKLRMLAWSMRNRGDGFITRELLTEWASTLDACATYIPCDQRATQPREQANYLATYEAERQWVLDTLARNDATLPEGAVNMLVARLATREQAGAGAAALAEMVEVVQMKVARRDSDPSADNTLEAREGCFTLIREHGAAIRAALYAAPCPRAEGVDEAMVERACEADWGQVEWAEAGDNKRAVERSIMRQILNAALGGAK